MWQRVWITRKQREGRWWMSWEFHKYGTNLKPICCGSCGRTPSNDGKTPFGVPHACRVIKYCNINYQRKHWSQWCHNKKFKTIRRQISFLRRSSKGTIRKGEWCNRYVDYGYKTFALGDNDDLLINHKLACKLLWDCNDS